MLQGFFYTLAACFIWGLIFIVPQFMTEFTPIEVALGRYFFYGVISICILLRNRLKGAPRYSFSIWIKALLFSLASTIVYYTAVVLSLRYSNPAICAIVLGISPIAIAFYGNWREKKADFSPLIVPSLLIIFGLLIINLPYFYSNEVELEHILGLLCGFIALASWSWYAVANAQFLKHHTAIQASDWSTLIGVATLVWVLLFGFILAIGFDTQIQTDKYHITDPSFLHFLLGSAILGGLCSWLGGYLWNKASLYLPVALAGQLTIFETIFGLCFVYTLAQQLPPHTEVLGICLLLAAVAYGLRLSYATQKCAKST